MAIECKHGQLARSCNICALEAELAEVTAQRDKLQELINAPEVEPVAVVSNFFTGRTVIIANKGVELTDGAPLYTAPPAPSVPVGTMENIALNEWLDKTEWVQKEINTFPVSSLGMHRADVMRLEIERLRKLLAAPTPAEAPADVARDAARWRMLPAFLEEFEISYLRLEDAIDAAMSEKGGA